MAGYKDLYEICREGWRQDWETSKSLTEKARTYVVVIGLVFGYSIFNLNSFLSLLAAPSASSSGVSAIKALFCVYLLSFGLGLVTTLLSLAIRDFSPLPAPETLEQFRDGGLSEAILDQGYHRLAELTTAATLVNVRRTARQAFWLKFAVSFLIAGAAALLAMAWLVFRVRVW